MLRDVIAMDGCESPILLNPAPLLLLASLWGGVFAFLLEWGALGFLFTVLSPLLVFAPLLLFVESVLVICLNALK